jgi:hypothetical protein
MLYLFYLSFDETLPYRIFESLETFKKYLIDNKFNISEFLNGRLYEYENMKFTGYEFKISLSKNIEITNNIKLEYLDNEILNEYIIIEKL